MDYPNPTSIGGIPWQELKYLITDNNFDLKKFVVSFQLTSPACLGKSPPRWERCIWFNDSAWAKHVKYAFTRSLLNTWYTSLYHFPFQKEQVVTALARNAIKLHDWVKLGKLIGVAIRQKKECQTKSWFLVDTVVFFVNTARWFAIRWLDAQGNEARGSYACIKRRLQRVVDMHGRSIGICIENWNQDPGEVEGGEALAEIQAP